MGQGEGATGQQRLVSLWLPIAAHASGNVCGISRCLAFTALGVIAKEEYLYFGSIKNLFKCYL